MSSSRSPLNDRTNLPLPATPTPAPARTTDAATITVNNTDNNAQATTTVPTTPSGPETATTVEDSPEDTVPTTINTIASEHRSNSRTPPDLHARLFAIPSVTYRGFHEHHLHDLAPPAKWKPSRMERMAATVAARNAQALLRRLEASKTLWNCHHTAELCDRYKAYNTPEGYFKPVIPVPDTESDERLGTFSDAIDGCDKAIRTVKRSLEQYACTFDRAREFEDSEETTDDLLVRYIWNGEHDGSRPKRRRPTTTPADTSSTTVAPPAVPAAPSVTARTSSVMHMSAYSVNEVTTTPGDERCTNCSHLPGTRAAHKTRKCPVNRGMMSPRP